MPYSFNNFHQVGSSLHLTLLTTTTYRLHRPHTTGAPEGSKGLLDESITFTAPGIGSYYFSMAAVNRVAQHLTDHPLALYR